MRAGDPPPRIPASSARRIRRAAEDAIYWRCEMERHHWSSAEHSAAVDAYGASYGSFLRSVEALGVQPGWLNDNPELEAER